KQRLAGESPKSKVQSPKSKVQSPKSKVQGPKSRIIGRFAELERSRRGDEADDVVERPNRLLTSAATEILPSSIIHHPSSPLFEVHSRPTYIPDYATPRFRLTPKHFAYLKIAEGCNHPCSFCIIPRMRGAHRSRAQTDAVTEARGLIAEGAKELNLISQDSTYYGLDLRPNHSRA